MSITLTTLTSLGGIQEVILADAIALFNTIPTLLGAFKTKAAVGQESTVRFFTQAVPSAASAHDESSELTISALTLTAKDAAIAGYPIVIRGTLLSLDGDGAMEAVSDALGAGLARTIDTAICALAANITTITGNNDSGVVTIDDFMFAVSELRTTGYNGRLVAVLHPVTIAHLGLAITAEGGQIGVGDAYMRTGHIATLGGVEIYQSPWVYTNGNAAYNIIAYDHAIGVGYKEPWMQIDTGLVANYASRDILGIAMFKAIEVTDGAACVLYDNISSAA